MDAANFCSSVKWSPNTEKESVQHTTMLKEVASSHNSSYCPFTGGWKLSGNLPKGIDLDKGN